MAYVKQDWKNLPDQSTPLSAARLLHMETQFDEAVAYTDEQIDLNPGPQGPQGPPGDTGSTGAAGTITSATATGLPEGTDPTVTLGGTASARTFAFGIPAGAAGEEGPQGPQGPGGDPGATGPSGTITGASASGLAAGAQPTVSLGGTASARTFAFGIPAGAKGDPGADGTSVNVLGTLPNVGSLPASGSPGDAYIIAGNLWVWSANSNDWTNAGPFQGPKGDDGAAGTSATITGATATGLAAGAAPTVTLGGTSSSRTFAFGIPAGATGAAGTPGAAGTITSATATGLAAGAAPTVTLGGTANSRTFAFGIPKGDKGDTGADGALNAIPQFSPTQTNDRLVFWDASAGAYAPLQASTGLSIIGTGMSVITASTSGRGIVQQATPVEAVAGTDDLKFVTPAGVKASVSSQTQGADLVSALRYPVYIAHRGATLTYPEHSIEAYRHAYAAGFSPEADVQVLADGTLVCIHDATTNRTMDLSKTVSAVTVAEWRKARILPATNGSVSSTGYGTPVFFEDYLDEFGGKTVLWPEIKTTNAAARTAVIKAITDRRLEKSIVVQSAVLSVATAAATAGCHALLLTDTVAPASIVAAGIGFVGVSAAATNAYVTSCVSAGLKVISYTQNTKVDADAQLARGVVGVFSNDPWEVSREFTPRGNLPSVSDGAIPLAISHSKENSGATEQGLSNQAVTVSTGGLLFTGGKTSGTGPGYSNALRLGQLGFNVPGTVTIRLWAQSIAPWSSLASGQETVWLFGVYLGNQAGDVAINEEALTSKFSLAMVRRNGQKVGYEKRTDTAAITNLGNVAAPATPYSIPLGPSPAMQFEVSFTPTTIGIKNLTLNDTPLLVTRTSLTLANSYITLGVTGSNSRIWGVEVL